MSRTSGLVLIARLACGVALSVGALVLPAYADTLSGTYTASLTGVSSTTVQASFTFNTTTDVFSGTLDFSGGSIFKGVTDSFSQTGPCAGGVCALALDANVSGDSLVYAIALNLSSDQYSAGGTITSPKGAGVWAYTGAATDPGGTAVVENWGLSESLGLFVLALLAFGVLTRLGVLRTAH
jgi:hypothetical protein